MYLYLLKKNTSNIARYVVSAVFLFTLLFTSQPVYAAAGLETDDFYPETVLNGMWTFVDPDGDSSYNLTGTHAEISVPAGSSHQFYGNQINAPRLLQSATDSDFHIEVKFDSVPDTQYQEQGIVVQQDNDTMLRIETYSNGSEIVFYAAFINNGTTTVHSSTSSVSSVPPYLRLQRSGNDWTFRYSYDGATWTIVLDKFGNDTFNQAMIVTEIGFYAGNAGTNPSFTARVDHFWDLDDASPTCIPVSDDFYPETSANANWRFEDPDGTSTLTMTGTNAEISVPSGSSHQFWDNQHNAPRLLQTAPDTDFGLEVKFDSVPTSRFQEQGIVVQQDSDTMLRIETYFDGTDVYLFAAFINGGIHVIHHQDTVASVPPYLRLQRQHSTDNWTFSYSNNGTSWTVADTFTQDMTVTEVGFYGGNHNPNPAFTVSADYFNNLACPITDETNRPPDVTNPGNQFNQEGDVVSLAISASDPDGDPIDFSAINLPPGLSINTSTGLISGTVNAGSAGVYDVEVNVSDSMLDTTIDFQWTISTGACVPVSDDFHPETTADPVWTFVDPSSDSTLTMTGTNAEISVAPGSAHEFWSGIHNAPHLVQSIPDADFGVEVKFESAPILQYQEQGIVVKQDNDTMLRIETFSDGTSIHLFAAYIDGSSATTILNQVVSPRPPYLRLVRNGDVWTYSTSTDGSSWTIATTFTRVMTANWVGFYGGNAGSNPAFTASADYFNNLACPITDTDTQAATPPVIDFWYGDTQTFGEKGNPQQWINVLGNVSDANGVASATYSLNGGGAVSIPFGPNGTRLVGNGDFNIEIDHADLIDIGIGPNTVEVTALDSLGASTSKTLTLNYHAGNVWPLPYTADWSTGITSAGQMVDGLWEQVAGGVKTIQTGYDRLITFGNETWGTDYEVTLPLTIHSASSNSGVGLGVGWQGHTGTVTPRTNWPLQAIGWLRNFPADTELRILTYPGTVEASLDRHDVTADTTYLLKVRSESLGAGNSRVSVKLWADGTTEPATWEITADVPTRDGSVLLIAHRADVTFGNVDVSLLNEAPVVTGTSLSVLINELLNSLTVTFNEEVYDPPGDTLDDDVTNVNNYILYERGPNGIYDTSSCTDATPPDRVLPDDVEVTINSVSYDVGSSTATLNINDGNPLDSGNYRLLVCGSTSIVDLVGNPLNGGNDYIYDFTLIRPSGAGGGNDAVSKITLPATGFAPGVVSNLPMQPASKAYKDYQGIWLEVPKLGLKSSIIGVPKTEDGWDVSWLGSNTGYLAGSAFPTLPGNTAITAHVFDANGKPGPFANLYKLDFKDRFSIHAWGMKYTYEVRSTYLVQPYNPEVLKHEEQDWVTLITCMGYNPDFDSYDFRRIVKAALIAVAPE